MLTITLKDFLAIHAANYEDNAAACILADRIEAKAKRPNVGVQNFPEFEDYCEVTDPA